MEEVLALARESLGEGVVARLRADFSDRAGDRGFIVASELGTLLRSHGFCPTEDELKEVTVPKDSVPLINISAVLNLAVRVGGKMASRLNAPELSKLFELYQVEGSGTTTIGGSEPEIPVAAFRNIMENAGDGLSAHEVEVLLQEMQDRGVYDGEREMLKYQSFVGTMVDKVKKQGGG